AGESLNIDPVTAVIPGDEQARAALGYVHANCGHCHGGPSARAGLTLTSVVGTASVADTSVYKGAVCKCLTRWWGKPTSDGGTYKWRIAAGDAAHSGIIARMGARGTSDQMPSLGSEKVDVDGIAAISTWIDTLDPAQCAESVVCAPPPPPAAGSSAAATAGRGGSGGSAVAPVNWGGAGGSAGSN
ncbi:MAG: hypothetical protein RL701_932, partial [Pseudomonadota bacterium]